MKNNDDLKSVLENSEITEEQRKAILDVLNKPSSKPQTKAKVEENDAYTETKNLTVIDRPTIGKDYFYEQIPCKFDLFKIFYLADTNMLLNKNSNLLGAFLLKWINEGKVKYSRVSGNLFKKPSYVITINPDLKFSDVYENEIFTFIKRACDGDYTLTDKEFKKFAEKKQFELQNLLDEICGYVEKKLVSEKLLTIKVSTEEEKVEDKNNPLNQEGITIKKTKTTLRNSKELENDIKHILGFKNFIKSLNTDPDVDIPNDYFVVTELLGISNFISYKFNEIYPEFYFRHLQFLRHLRNSIPAEPSAFSKVLDIGKMQIK